jgi:hypothetical protein
VKDLLYAFDSSKPRTSRFFVAALLRMTLQNDIATRSNSDKGYSLFSKKVTKSTKLRNSKILISEPFVSFVRFVVKGI